MVVILSEAKDLLMKQFRTLFRALLIALVATVVARGVMLLKAPRDLEATLFDVRQLAFVPPTQAADDVVMVWLDEATMQGLPYRTPIPRDFLARLQTTLAAAKPKLIAYDIFFKGASFPEADAALAEALVAHPAYGVVPRRADGVVDMPDAIFLPGLAGVGLADLPFNPFDATVRSAQLSFATDRGPMRSFAAELFHAATGREATALVADRARWPHLGPLTLTPYARDEDISIRFAGPPSREGDANNAFKVYSAGLVAKGVLPSSWFADKIVLVGASYADLKDAFLTPYYAAATDYAQMNGVEIHANILSMLLTDQLYFHPQPWQVWTAIALLTFAMGWCAVRFSPWPATGLFVVVLAGVVAAAAAAFRGAGIVLPIVSPALGLTAAYGAGLGMKALTEGRQKRFIKGVFARYVPAAVVERMTQNPELLKLGGEERVVTSLFSDIASFTSISERMNPTQLVAFLNDYLGRMNALLFEYGATIDKYEGDAIIAFFNAPLPVERHELAAARAAVGMRRVSEAVTEEWGERLGRAVVTRVGINTGTAVVGNMGSEGRFDYTAIGDTINLASRLEGTNKFYRTVLMASETTVAALGDAISTRPVDRVRVKGKNEPILLYEIVAEAGDMSEGLRSTLLAPYEEAFEHFSERRFDEARRLCEIVLARHPQDGPTEELMVRIAKAQQEPGWDLVTDLMAK